MAAAILLSHPIFQSVISDLSFAEGWQIWYRGKAQEIGPKTQNCYREYERALSPFFGALRLRDITLQHIIVYREERKKTAGPNLINHEINALAQLLQQVDLWNPIRKLYKQMRVRKGGPGQRLSTEELSWLLKVAQTEPRWRVAYYCALLPRRRCRTMSSTS